MNKPWSITTTLRNPYRNRDFLKVLKTMEDKKWDKESQVEFQVKLIQHRYYGYGSTQFYSGLPQETIQKIDNPDYQFTFSETNAIFEAKNFLDPPMRGRQSFNALKKLGFACLQDQRIKITSTGEKFLADDYDLREVFLQVLLKWQIPNPYYARPFNSNEYNIIPFVGSLDLIQRVNDKESDLGRKPKGMSKDEFSIFAHTLIHSDHIDRIAQAVVNLRVQQIGKTRIEKEKLWDSQTRKHAAEFLGTNESKEIDKLLKNLKEYGDNTIRYFRLTGLVHIRGNGFYIDLEPRREVEIKELLNSELSKVKNFSSEQEFVEYISDPKEPKLPWETYERELEIINGLQDENYKYEVKLGFSPATKIELGDIQTGDRKQIIFQLEQRRRDLFDIDRYNSAQSEESIEKVIQVLENIRKYEQRAILLEHTATKCLSALNDSIKIDPQYPVGDDNKPTFTAPANTPDIECFYESFNAICEVTMLVNRQQWYNEGQPVMRHLRDFENRYPTKPAYCLFVAPRMHRDTINTFWASIKLGYEGRKQRIVPLTLSQLSEVMKILLQSKSNNIEINHSLIQLLFDNILETSNSSNDSVEWTSSISSSVSAWKEKVFQ